MGSPDEATEGHISDALDALWPEGTFVSLLTQAARDELFQLGQRRRKAYGEILVYQGETSRHVIVLLEGFARVAATSSTGHERLLAFRRRGDLIGELAAIDNMPRTANVTAASSVIALFIGQEQFSEFLDHHSGAERALNKVVMNKLRSATRDRVEAGLPVATRVARVLDELVVDIGQSGMNSLVLPVPLTQTDIANLTGLAEPTVHRALKELRREEVISTGYRRIAILNPEQLHKIGHPEELPL